MARDVSQADWPAMSLAEAFARLTGPGSRFEIGEEEIRGRRTRVWRRIPRNLAELFEGSRRFGPREFLVYEDDRVTYEAFRRASIHLAERLIADGAGKGDRVALIMRNLPEWPVAFYGSVIMGAINVPLNGWWTGPELEFGLADSGARIAIVDEERLARILPHLDACPALERIYVARPSGPLPDDPRIASLDAVLGAPERWGDLPDAPLPAVAIAPDDDAAILYTSGTTGKPKGAIASHRNICCTVAAAALPGMVNLLRCGQPVPSDEAAAAMAMTGPQRVNLLAVPLFHATGLTGQLVLGLNAGARVVLMRRWDVDQAVALIEAEQVTATGGVPTIAWQLVERAERGGADLSSLTGLTFGGAPASPELVRRIAANFPRAVPGSGWGMTETCAAFAMAVGRDYSGHPESAGYCSPVCDLQIRDPEDGTTVLPVGATGEIWARGPQVVRGYWNRPEATAETFVDGWLRTGDIGRLDAEGYLAIVDRAKDMLIRGGENIYCLEVEHALHEHPDVLDAAVVGRPHPTLGEEPVAVVHLRPGGRVSAAELREAVGHRLAAFKVPVEIRFWPELLPRNANGKVLKAELRKLFVPAGGA
ncbi:class I adenylate-forming enzyme family protein [Novosphingobium bradum]|uniref:Class I adenylate-forming enzyme family protein n=1 Tax=Novosphingobium bradum TaxID=1737444 RepID=A0ABV7IR92_9SPHN